MTVAEIKVMINEMNDADEVIFVGERMDRDGYPYEVSEEVIAIVPNGTEKIDVGYGIERYNRKNLKKYLTN